MSLIIIAKQETERHALEEAFQNIVVDVKTYTHFTDIKASKDHGFVLTTDDLEIVQGYIDEIPVFLITDEDIVAKDDIDGNFEDIFVRPIRLGRVVDAVAQAIKEQELHQLLSPIQLGEVTLNPKTSHIDYNNKSIRLTEKELAVLIFLSQHKDVAVSRQKLLDEVWGYADNVETHTLETHIYRLRQKLQTQMELNNFLVTDDDGYFLKF